MSTTTQIKSAITEVENALKLLDEANEILENLYVELNAIQNVSPRDPTTPVVSTGLELDERSKKHLKGVNPVLKDLIVYAFHTWPYSNFGMVVVDGLRTHEEQAKLVAEGKSRTYNSRHLTGHAVDIVVDSDRDEEGLQPQWAWKYYQQMAEHIKVCAEEKGVELDWGGDWVSFKDGLHFELDRQVYPV